MAANVEPDHLEFRGQDLKECEQFIAAVNKRAREEGKFRDDQWIADLVGASMAGDALIWWSSLDDETQESWKLLRKAMLSRYRLHFTGKSSAEADGFVHWIRQRALDAGKLDDPSWPAKLASECFVGNALRWYTALDPRIQEDWKALQQAIFLRYNEGSEEMSLSSIVPTAAAAAGPNTSNPRSRGRIQVRRESDSGVYYLSKVLPENSMSPGRVMVTQRLAEALEVEYLSPSDNPQALLIPDNQFPDCDLLGMKWLSADPSPSSYLRLCGVKSSTGTGSPGPKYVGPLLAKPWKISRPLNGQGNPPLRVIGESGSRLLPASGQSPSKNEIWFVPENAARAVNLELFFEPV